MTSKTRDYFDKAKRICRWINSLNDFFMEKGLKKFCRLSWCVEQILIGSGVGIYLFSVATLQFFCGCLFERPFVVLLFSFFTIFDSFEGFILTLLKVFNCFKILNDIFWTKIFSGKATLYVSVCYDIRTRFL